MMVVCAALLVTGCARESKGAADIGAASAGSVPSGAALRAEVEWQCGSEPCVAVVDVFDDGGWERTLSGARTAGRFDEPTAVKVAAALSFARRAPSADSCPADVAKVSMTFPATSDAPAEAVTVCGVDDGSAAGAVAGAVTSTLPAS